jgi:dihydroxyacetone kinase-like protein
MASISASGGAGVVHIVKNYTGDVMNFQMAAELAEDEDIEVVPVVIDDDVAVQDSTFTAGRRGTGGTGPAGATCPRGIAADAVDAELAVELEMRPDGVADVAHARPPSSGTT